MPAEWWRYVMSTLLLRLAAPIQAWGVDKFERASVFYRQGNQVAAALGRRRNEV